MREPIMKKTIILVSSEEEQLADLTDTLETHDYHAIVTRSTDALETLLREHSSRVILLDLDAVPVDNRFFRQIKERNPTLHVIVISGFPFHPELKEAILSHIDVCLSKPINPDDLFYWLRSISHDPTAPESTPDEESEKGPMHKTNCQPPYSRR
jgi:DNA-binding NtrC family response regulator